MANYKIPHPWNPGYAIPDYILAEPPGRAGTMTTAQLPRGTMGSVPKGWTGGYTLPDYILSEPHKRGAIATQQMLRKTIPSYLPNAFGADDDPTPPGYEFPVMDLRPKSALSAIPTWAYLAAGAAILFFMVKK